MTTIELFGCSGGMAEGFRRAGIEFDLTIDRDPNACVSYAANLGRKPVVMDVADCARLLDIVRPTGPINLLVADPPCTPWSRAGSCRGLDDERDCLRITVEMIRRLLPTSYLIGNVPGLDNERNLGVVQELIGGLAQDGYCVRDFAVLNAADYGVPQKRIRPFWFGHRGGACIHWPATTHCDPRLPSLFGDLQPWVMCAQALAHMSPDQIGKPLWARFTQRNHRGSQANRQARTITTNTHSDGALIRIDDRHPPSSMDPPAHTILARDRSCGGTLLAWPRDAPATTICADERLPPPGHHDSAWMSHPNAVVLSERAALILQGFPETWHIEGRTKKARWSQIGQAMPPPLADAVARSIRAQACFVKQLGARPMDRSFVDTEPFVSDLRLRDRKGADLDEWPKDLRVREFPRVTGEE